MEDQIDETLAKTLAVTDRICRNVALTVQVGNKIGQDLEDQTDQLKRIQADVESTDHTLNRAYHHIRSMQTCCWCFPAFSRLRRSKQGRFQPVPLVEYEPIPTVRPSGKRFPVLVPNNPQEDAINANLGMIDESLAILKQQGQTFGATLDHQNQTIANIHHSVTHVSKDVQRANQASTKLLHT